MSVRWNRPVSERGRERHGQPAHILVHKVHPEEPEAQRETSRTKGRQEGRLIRASDFAYLRVQSFKIFAPTAGVSTHGIAGRRVHEADHQGGAPPARTSRSAERTAS